MSATRWVAINIFISLADAAVVVTSASGSGGTWSGAIENMRQGWVPLWVKPTAVAASGNMALLRQGARALAELPVEIAYLALPETSHLRVSEPAAPTTAVAPGRDIPPETPYRSFLQRLEVIAKEHPITAREVEEKLGLEKPPVSKWLKQAVAEGWVEKLTKPVRYVWHGAPVQNSMFG